MRASNWEGNSRNACKWKKRKTSSTYEGVSWAKKMNAWQSYIDGMFIAINPLDQRPDETDEEHAVRLLHES